MNMLLVTLVAIAAHLACLVPTGQAYALDGFTVGTNPTGTMAPSTLEVMNRVLGNLAARRSQSTVPTWNEAGPIVTETTVQPASMIEQVSTLRPIISRSTPRYPTRVETVVEPATVVQTTPVSELLPSRQSTPYQMLSPMWNQAYASAYPRTSFVQPAAVTMQQQPLIAQFLSSQNQQYPLSYPAWTQDYASVNAQRAFIQPAVVAEQTVMTEPMISRPALSVTLTPATAQFYTGATASTLAPELVVDETIVGTTVSPFGSVYEQSVQATSPVPLEFDQRFGRSFDYSLGQLSQLLLPPGAYLPYQPQPYQQQPYQPLPYQLPGPSLPYPWVDQPIAPVTTSQPYVVQSGSNCGESQVQVVTQPQPYYVPYPVPRTIPYPVYQPIYVPVTQAPIVEEVIVQPEPVVVVIETTTTEPQLVTVTQVLVTETLMPMTQPLEPCAPREWGVDRVNSMLPATLATQLNGQYDVLKVWRTVDPDVTFRMALRLSNGQCREYALVPNTAALVGSTRRPEWKVSSVDTIVCPIDQSRVLSQCPLGSF